MFASPLCASCIPSTLLGMIIEVDLAAICKLRLSILFLLVQVSALRVLGHVCLGMVLSISCQHYQNFSINRVVYHVCVEVANNSVH